MNEATYYREFEAEDAMSVLARWMGRNRNLKVVYHNGTAVDADTFNGVIRVPRLACASGITQEALMLLRSRVYHEAGHIDETSLPKSEYPKGALHEIWNALEDRRMEWSEAQKHKGCEVVFRWSTQHYNRKIGGKISEGLDKPLWEALVAMSILVEGVQLAWHPGRKAQDYIDAAYGEFIKVKQCKNARECLELAKVIYKLLKEVNEEWKQAQPPPPPQESNDQEQGDDQEQGEGREGEGEGEGQDGEPSSGGGKDFDDYENDNKSGKGDSDAGDSGEAEADGDDKKGKGKSDKKVGKDGDDKKDTSDGGDSGDSKDSGDGKDSGDSDSDSGDDDSSGKAGDEGDGDSDSGDGDESGDSDKGGDSDSDSGKAGDDGDDEDGDESGDSDKDKDSGDADGDGAGSESGDAEGDSESQEDGEGADGGSTGGEGGNEGKSDAESDGSDAGYKDGDGKPNGDVKPGDVPYKPKNEEPKGGLGDGKDKRDLEDETEGMSKEQAQNEDLEEFFKNMPAEDKQYTSRRDLDSHSSPETSEEDKVAYRQRLSEVSVTVASMTRALEQALRSLSKCRKNPYQRQGKIDHRRLVAIAKNISREVFYKVKEGIKLDVAVAITIDESGSMGNFYEVQLLALAIGEALNAIKVPFEIIGTTTAYGGGDHRMPRMDGFTRVNPIVYRHYKLFGEQWANVRQRIIHSRAYHHNIDGEVIEYAAFRLAQRPESRKVIFSLSDGEPCGGHGNDEEMCSNLKRVCKRVRKQGIEVYGFGVGTDTPRGLYGKEWFIYLEDIEKIGQDFVREFARIVTEGKVRV